MYLPEELAVAGQINICHYPKHTQTVNVSINLNIDGHAWSVISHVFNGPE